MFQENLALLYERDLNKLKVEIGAYLNEEDLWVVDKNISNSAGNLCLHICGNLQHFVGHHLGKTNYERNREGEFNDKHIPREKMMLEIDKTIELINRVIPSLTDKNLQVKDPAKFNNWDMEVQAFLISIYGHLNYHLGQINYHRRLLSE